VRVSAVVSTRNRPAQVAACAISILANPDLLELIFIDQSDDEATEHALAAVADPRLRYVRSEQRGVTNGRNLGIAKSLGDIVAFTDDDCRVTADWVASLAKIFNEDPQAAVVCGRVRTPAELEAQGFTTGFEPQEREWQGRYPPPERDWGITANMSLRRSVVDRVGAFDPFLGVGAPLRSGGEPDFLFRVLKDGGKVVNASEVVVEHFGVRPHGAEATALWRQYGVGTAAALFKHVRLGDIDAGRLYLRHLRKMAGLMAKNLLLGRRPIGLGYTLALLEGARASFRFGVDRKRRQYVAR
jgi:Glycosyl transferase family 2